MSFTHKHERNRSDRKLSIQEKNLLSFRKSVECENRKTKTGNWAHLRKSAKRCGSAVNELTIKPQDIKKRMNVSCFGTTEVWQLKQSAWGGVFYHSAFCASLNTENVFSSNNRSRYGIMVRGRRVYSSCIIHEREEVCKRGLKMTLVVGRGLSAPLHHSGQHNVHIICREYNVIATTCRVCRMQPWSEWPSVHVFRLRQANLRPSLRSGSRVYEPPQPRRAGMAVQSFWCRGGGSSHHPLAVLNGLGCA